MVLHDEAPVEGFVHGHAQAPAQLGQSDEQQAESGGGVHVEVGQQLEVLDHVVSEVVGSPAGSCARRCRGGRANSPRADDCGRQAALHGSCK